MNENEVVIEPVNKIITLPTKKLTQTNSIIKSISNEDIDSIMRDETLTTAYKIEYIQDKIATQESKMRILKQPAALGRCLDIIKEYRSYLTLLKSDGELIEYDEDDDMDVFSLIELNAIQVAVKRSNALIVTGDPGVGKTFEIIKAISFLNPRKNEYEIIEPEDEIEEVKSDVDFVIEIENENVEDDIEEIVEEKPIIKTFQLPTKKGSAKVKNIKINAESRNNVESGYFIASGTCTSAALYELLFCHRNKLLVFDDFDSILKDDDCMNLLKAALDTFPMRELSKMTKGNSFSSFGMTDSEMWDEYEITGKVPNQFKFTGNIIFISNIHEDKFDKALISRSLHVEVRLTKQQIIERMHKLMLDIRPEVCLEYKQEALHYLEYLTSNFICKFDLNIRELIHAIDYKAQHPEDKHITKTGKEILIWQQLLKKRIVKTKVKY